MAAMFVLGWECGLELGSGSKLVHVARQARATGRGRHAVDEFERVRIEWKAE